MGRVACRCWKSLGFWAGAEGVVVDGFGVVERFSGCVVKGGLLGLKGGRLFPVGTEEVEAGLALVRLARAG